MGAFQNVTNNHGFMDRNTLYAFADDTDLGTLGTLGTLSLTPANSFRSFDEDDGGGRISHSNMLDENDKTIIDSWIQKGKSVSEIAKNIGHSKEDVQGYINAKELPNLGNPDLQLRYSTSKDPMANYLKLSHQKSTPSNATHKYQTSESRGSASSYRSMQSSIASPMATVKKSLKFRYSSKVLPDSENN